MVCLLPQDSDQASNPLIKLEHDEYDAAMEAYAQAEGRWEELKDQKNKAELVMEAWRTMSSNERSVMRATR